MLGKIKDKRRRGHQRMRWLDAITRCNGHELGQAWGDGEGQGGLACCHAWGHKKSDTTGRLNNNEQNNSHSFAQVKPQARQALQAVMLSG